MKATERFINYVKINTTSDSASDTSPSTYIQFDLANKLAEEMKNLAMSNVSVSEHCYVYGTLEATPDCENAPVIGFVAHMDTSPDFSGRDIQPQIIENYDGNDIFLKKGNRCLTINDFPHLASLKGRTLILTDGTTLLGADNKAGIAEILTACEKVTQRSIPHGKICIAFTPDEEIGKGTDFFDRNLFTAEFAYTVDGGQEGEINFENFNACEAVFQIQGVNVHPGSAKNIMLNASLAAFEINNMLPSADTPRNTEGYEGFFHLTKMEGTVESARLEYIVRDHSQENFAMRKKMLQHIEKVMNEKYGDGTVQLSITEQYANMAALIEPHQHLIDSAVKAMETVGFKPILVPIRGGTDGARLTYQGLPCPNLCTGGYAFHGPFEHITAESLENCAEMIVEIIKIYSEKTIL